MSINFENDCSSVENESFEQIFEEFYFIFFNNQVSRYGNRNEKESRLCNFKSIFWIKKTKCHILTMKR